MKQGHTRKQESPRDRVGSALGRIGYGIEWNQRSGCADGDELVRLSMDAMASALIEWRDLDLAAAPLDAVLAELGADDELVETTGQLIRLLGRATYYGGLTEVGVRQAEELREEIMSPLEELVTRFEEEEPDDSDP